MAYCTITEVQALNPKRTYDADSTPTLTQAEALISQIAAEIDTVLKGRSITTPVTAPTAFVDYLKQINAYGSAALAEMGMFPEAVGTQGGSPQSDRLWRIYTKAMTFLEKGDLPSAIRSGDPASFFTEHPVAEPTEDYAWRTPKFRKNQEF